MVVSVRVNEAQQALNKFTLELTMCVLHIVQIRTSSIETFLFRRNLKVLCQQGRWRGLLFAQSVMATFYTGACIQSTDADADG